MGQIFVSYSRRDTRKVDRVVGAMEDSGLDVWIDREDIKAGNTWRVQIVQAIDTCDAFILMLSPHSASSDNVRKEIDLAQDAGRTIFIVLLAPTKLPVEIRYQLAGLQYVDLPMLGFERAAEQLIEALKEHCAKLEPAIETSTRQVEMVIKGIDVNSFDTYKQEQLLEFISRLTNADRSLLSIANIATGSMHVFVEMPATTAFGLKTLALNRDKRFKRLGVVSLRILGDLKFINISLGILTSAATLSFLEALWLRIPVLFSSIFGDTVGKTLTILSAGAIVLTTTLVLLGVIVVITLLFPRNTPSHPVVQFTSLPPTSISTPSIPPTAILPTPVTPTMTSTPEILQFFTEEFEQDLKHWPYFVKDGRTNVIIKDPVDKVVLNVSDGFFTIDILDPRLRIYSIYDQFEYEDVRIDARVANLGTNDNYFSLVCRYSKEYGWYEFNVTSGGLFVVQFAKPNEEGFISYNMIANGGSNMIKQGFEVNEYSAICQGETLTLYINGILTKEIRDARLKSGKIGISAASFKKIPVKFNLDWLKISQP